MSLYRQCAEFSLQVYDFDYAEEHRAINFSSVSDIQASIIQSTICMLYSGGTETEADHVSAPFWTKFKDWFVNLRFKMVGLGHGSGIKIHRGYYESLSTIFGQLKNVIDSRIGYRRLIITGHSAGGAYARLFQYLLRYDRPDSIAITFGEPRGGNSAYAKASDKLINVRFINECDPVPFGPPLFLGYRHAKFLRWLSADYQEIGHIHFFKWLKHLFM